MSNSHSHGSVQWPVFQIRVGAFPFQNRLAFGDPRNPAGYVFYQGITREEYQLQQKTLKAMAAVPEPIFKRNQTAIHVSITLRRYAQALRLARHMITQRQPC